MSLKKVVLNNKRVWKKSSRNPTRQKGTYDLVCIIANKHSQVKDYKMKMVKNKKETVLQNDFL